QGGEVQRPGEPVALEPAGTVAEILEVDSPRSGILQLRCRGSRRFRLHGTRQAPDGLWLGEVEDLPDDEAVPPEPQRAGAVALRRAVESLRGQGAEPFLAPLRYDDAGWVANRWCEILPISLAAKQRLMALEAPQLRLQLVDDYLREKGVVG
ncbi:LON peptidase substrate-binding domain-containing protein, partial [Piscinibacter sakaiensis]|uniref:LON peptidase substrate-binding domain-containing protein n=1 Tax=Piscinibacter sakaiensis TaxID=1547922 RepID=UPI003727B9AA